MRTNIRYVQATQKDTSIMEQATIVNRYRLKREIGEGGMGKVYRAYDRLTGQDIALKQVTAPTQRFDVISRAPTGTYLDKVLAHEFRVLASLRHPHIISVLDYGFNAQQQPFFTMTLLDNAQTIYRACANVSRETHITLLLQMLQALQYLHRRGILHRDLKPGNVLVVDEHVYLLDFGLALESSFARSHEAGGTLPYMPPEVVVGKAVSPATDLYSFGVMAYEILLGQHPFDIKSQATLIGQILTQPVEIPMGVLDVALEAFLLRLLAKDPADRYASASDTIQALCRATNLPMPEESSAIRDSFIMAAQFVGRETELQTLQNALDAALNSQGSAWLIGGESGVGKSRLLDELRIAALVNGALVIRGQAISEGGLSYQIWRDILPHLVLLLSLEDDEIAILRQLVPHIEQLVGRSLSTDFKLNDAVLKNRLSLVLVDVVLRVTELRPLVLILEDLQWAGESLDILKQLLPQARQKRLLILGNYRSDESPNLPDTLANMQHLTLKRMDEAGIRKLSMSMLGKVGENEDVVRLLERETEGNTFFIVEVVRALAEEAGQLANIGRVTIPAHIFAGGIQHVVQRRLSRLPEWAHPIVVMASIIGRQVDRKLIAHLMPLLDVDEWLRVCSDAAVFSVEGERWQFAHDKLREHLLDNLPQEEKPEYHARIAAAIEAIYQDELNDYAEVLTKHFAAAGNRGKEAQYAAMACEPTLSFSPSDALNYALRAIELEAYLQATNPRVEQARLHYVGGCACVRLSLYDDARKHLETSLTLASEADYPLGIAQANNVLGEMGTRLGGHEQAMQRVQDSLKIFRELNDLNHIYYALTNLAILNAQQGNMDAANQYIMEAVDVVSKANNPIALAQAYNNLAIIYDRRQEFDTAIDIHERALAIRRYYKDRPGMASSLVNLGAIKADLGQFDEAKQSLEEGISIFRLIGNQHGLARSLEMLANACEKHEEYDSALAYYQESLAIVHRIGEKQQVASNFISLGHLQLSMSDLEGAKNSALSALVSSHELNLLPGKVQALFLLALVTWEQNQVLKAVRWFGLLVKHRENIMQKQRYDEAIEKAKEILSSELFDKAFEAGQNSNIDEEITLVLQQEGTAK